jgi:putative salt-induced outer membrane protein
MKAFFVALAAIACTAGVAHAEDDTAPNGWTGEGSLSAGYTTGNTETKDLGLGVKLNKEAGVWAFGIEAAADYGEIDGEESKNRIYAGLTADREINDRLFGFGRVSHERDEFTGFESRTFVGGGLGYHVLDGEQAKWTVRGGPGLKIDEVRAYDTVDGNNLPITIPAETTESLGAIASSEFAYKFNESVSFTNNTSVLYAEESTQLSNTAALTAALTGKLSARFSFDVRHDTDPPLGYESTDTATRVSLVYAF